MSPISASPAARQRARVTVITRTKDRPLLLGRCVASVLKQTCRDWLHVIVNDGGNAHVARMLLEQHATRYAGRLEVIDHPTSQGMQNASNRALDAAAGEFVVIHDDDDSWEPDFLRACLERLDHEGPSSAVQGVITQTTRILEEMNDRGGIDELAREEYLPVKTIELFAAGADNPFPPIAFVYRRAVHERIGRFEERFSVVGDWDFNLRFLTQYEIAVIDRRLANYHWRHKSAGSIYANTVTDALDQHAQKTTELRNHYLRLDLQSGHLGLGYLMGSSHLLSSQAKALGSSCDLGKEAVHEIHKVHNRLRRWEWFFTRNGRLKGPASPSLAAGYHGANGSVSKPGCRAAVAALFDGKRPAPRVLSLDIFDTALLRLVRQPIDAFLLMAPAIRRQIGADAELPVAILRVTAERAARSRQLLAARHEEVSLTDIYEVFCELAGIDPAVHRDPLIALETAIETTLLYPDPAVLAAAAAAARAGARVIFVSDMYLPRAFILSELRRAGFAAPDGSLFLSWERGISKHGGGLFDAALRELGCEPADVTHVGDNLRADVESPRARGIQTIHWAPDGPSRPFVDQANGSAPPVVEGDLLSSVCTGLVRRSRVKTNAELWDRLGYEVGGPLYFTFLHWLLRQARTEGRKRLFFLARDGYYLRQACALMAERAGFAIEAVEMAASRRLLNLPQITALDHSALQFLLTPNLNLNVGHFLSRLGLDPGPLADQIRRAGFTAADELITTSGGAFRNEDAERSLRTLFRSLEGPILAQAATERARLHTYFDQVGFTPANAADFAVVDLGWQASSARALQTLLNLRTDNSPHASLRAYYFGTWSLAQTAVEAGCQLSSFFFHLDKPPHRRALVTEGVELIELFFGAPHPTIVGLQEGADGRMEPVHGEPDHADEEHRAAVTRMRERALDFVRDAAALAPAGELLDWSGDGCGYLEAVLERFLRQPSADEARVLGALVARDSFGGDSPSRPLARPPGRWERLLHPGRLRQAYQHAFWKRGYLAQLTPREAARAQAPR